MNLVDRMALIPMEFKELKQGTILIVSDYSHVADFVFGDEKYKKMTIKLGDRVVVGELIPCLRKGEACAHCKTSVRFFVNTLGNDCRQMSGCHFKYKTLNGREISGERG